MPTYLYQRVKDKAKDTNVSRYISQTVEDEIMGTSLPEPVNPVADFIQFADRLPKIPISKILAAIDKGRQ